MGLMCSPLILKGNYSGGGEKTALAPVGGKSGRRTGNPLAEEETLVHVAFVLIKTLHNPNICFPTRNPHHRRAVISHSWNLGRAWPRSRTTPDSVCASGGSKYL